MDHFENKETFVASGIRFCQIHESHFLEPLGNTFVLENHPFFYGMLSKNNLKWADTLATALHRSQSSNLQTISSHQLTSACWAQMIFGEKTLVRQESGIDKRFERILVEISAGTKIITEMFIQVWDAMVLPQQTALPNGNQMVEELLSLSSAQTKGPRKKKKLGNTPQSFWRARRTELNTANLSSAKLARAATFLNSLAATQLEHRGLLSIEPVSVVFSKQRDNPDCVVSEDLSTVILSDRLVSHPWGTLCAIVRWAQSHSLFVALQKKHEFKHASTNEIWVSAWKMLGVETRFRTTAQTIESVPSCWRENIADIPEDERRYLEKIDKLFSLGRSSNEHEAALAMQRANELLRTRNLERGRTGAGTALQDHYVSLTISLDSMRRNRVADTISSLLRAHFFVSIVWAQEFDISTQSWLATVELLGRRENVLLAEHAFDFLMHQCESLWQNAKKKSNSLSAKSKLSYQLGLIAGFREKLDSQKVSSEKAPQNGADDHSILVQEDSILDDFVSNLYPKLVRKSKAKLTLDSRALHAGKKDGMELNIHTPIASNSKSKSAASSFFLK